MGSEFRITRRVFLHAAAGSLFAAAAPLRFGVVTDVHYADREPAGTRFYRQALSKMRACVDLMNSEKVDFFIELGDFKDQDVKPNEASTLEFLRAVERVFAGFKGPRFHVLGNHDTDSITKQQFQSVVRNTGIDPARTWYSFDRGGCHFVVLDACFRKDMVAYSRGDYDWREANISPPQLDWLVKDLSASRRPTVVFSHQRLDEDKESGIGNRATVRKILEESGKIVLVMHGHIHTGDYQSIAGIPYYTQVASVEGDNPSDRTCTIVKLDGGAVTLTAYGRAKRLQE